MAVREEVEKRLGAFYNSICVPGAERQRVTDSLERWLGSRGFERSDRPVLFDLEGDNERCAFLISSALWTLVIFSNYDEERRLIRELQTWSSSVLYVWVQDSDVWGYDVFDADDFAGSFNSDPRSYCSFDNDGGGGAQGGERPEIDVEAFCRRFGLDGAGDELRAIHRKKAIFKEDVCREFCRLIDAAPALTSYDDLERGGARPSDEWQVERLLFVHRDAAKDAADLIDLHDARLNGVWSSPESTAIEIPPEVLQEVKRRRDRPRLTVRLLKPLSWLARTWSRAIEATARLSRRRPAPRRPSWNGSSPRDSSGVIEVRHLINERHRCRIRLAPGGQAQQGSSKPASVFAFQIGPTAVTCTARRRSHVASALQRPGSSQILRDEKYLIGGLKARHVVFQLPPFYLAGTPDPSYLGLHVVQTDWALYVFLYRFPKEIVKDVERAIRTTVSSFRILA